MTKMKFLLQILLLLTALVVTLAQDADILIATSYHGIQVLYLGTSAVRQIGDNSSPTSGVTYSLKHRRIYWTDMDKNIKRANFDGSEVEVIYKITSYSASIAYDWIADNVYFTDSMESEMIICTSDGVKCTTFKHSNFYSPDALVVDPIHGVMYWTSYFWAGSTMYMAGLDGSNSQSIVGGIKLVRNIVVDYSTSKLFWDDTHYYAFESSNLDGTNRTSITPLESGSYTWGSGTLGDKFYWSDNNLGTIQRRDKSTGSNVEAVYSVPSGVYQIAVIHPSNQPTTRENHCQGQPCSHICTLTPKSFSCLCPQDFKLDRDGRNCVAHLEN